MNEGGLLSFIKRSQKKWLVLALVAAGVILLFIGSLSGGGQDPPQDESTDMISYAEMLEARIVDLCEQVAGVSDVSVLLTLDGGVERIYAENSTGGGQSYVVISAGGEEKVVLVREICSSVRGIAVVCHGGENISIRRTLTELLSCALGVPISKISVAGAGK